ncbi:hypothetical protein P7C71_g4215, partial [Lecanoromycetidae sp. Uapishka_2]
MDRNAQHNELKDQKIDVVDWASTVEKANVEGVFQNLDQYAFPTREPQDDVLEDIVDTEDSYFLNRRRTGSQALSTSTVARDNEFSDEHLSSNHETRGPTARDDIFSGARSPTHRQASGLHSISFDGGHLRPNDYSWPVSYERYNSGMEEQLRTGSSSRHHGTRASAGDVFNHDFYEAFPWARGTDPFDESQTVWRPAEWYLENRGCISTEPLDETAEVPPAIAFVKGLISLEMDDLEDDEQHCPICLQRYREGEEEEMPLELGCGHVAGGNCLLLWLTALADEEAYAHGGSCPVCRKACIKEKRQHINTDEGLRQLLRDANYLLTAAGPLRLTTEGREEWEGIKDYVKGYLAEGKERMRQVHERFMMIMKLEIYRNPIFQSIATALEDLDAIRESLVAELENLERCGIIAEFLEVESNQEEERLEARIAGHLAAAPEALQWVMHNVRDGRVDSSDFDSEIEDVDDEIGLPRHDGTDRQLNMRLVANYVEQTRQVAQFHDAGRTYVLRPSQPITESRGSGDLLWCASCDTIHRHGSYHWGRAGVRDDEASW